MTAPISTEEISKALHGMNPDKAPGPDGFTARFYTTCWDIIQKDLVKMVRKSQNCSKIGGSTNSSFLALIPKEKGAQNFSRFRPISLCNMGYKVITKVIAYCKQNKKNSPKDHPREPGGLHPGKTNSGQYYSCSRGNSFKLPKEGERYGCQIGSC